MSKSSRRALARYAVDQLLAGLKPQVLAKQLSASLVESGRTGDYELLLNDISWELEQRQILAIGRVTSAHPLSKELESKLKTQIKSATKASDVLLETAIDKSVLGGFRIETAGRIWDETISGKLAQLRESA